MKELGEQKYMGTEYTIYGDRIYHIWAQNITHMGTEYAIYHIWVQNIT